MSTDTLVKHSKRTLRTPCDTCGAMNLYKGHDTSKRGDYCFECSITGGDVLLNYDGTLHVCEGEKKPEGYRAWSQEQDRAEQAAELGKKASEAVPATTPAPTVTGEQMAALAALQTVFGGGTQTVDRAEVEKIAREVVDGIVYPTKTVVVKDGVKREVEGSTHRQLADVTTAVLSGEHVMMVGPAGTGKSTIAEQAAEALSLECYSISLSPQTPASAILGYMQATGDYVGTLFRKAYEHGGVFHFDEVDNAHPSVLAVVNAALANGHMAFPDGMCKRHDEFRVVASANTYGRGATRQYVGRQQLDAATLDRFTVLTIDIDEALETALANSTGANTATVDKVLKYVRKLRKAAEDNGLNVVISPRASVGMCRLLHAGMDWDQAVDARVRRGLDDSTWGKLTK